MRISLARTCAAAVVAATVAGAAFVSPALAENPMVGGSPMYESKTIVENAVNSKDHETLVAAVKAAGLVETLSGPGPFIVFAPTDAAFDKLPAGTVATLVKPENKAKLTEILTYHVVAGRGTVAQMHKAAMEAGGSVGLETVNGELLTVKATDDGGITLTDKKGNTARVTIADVRQSNGIIQVVDTVLMP
ncbi:fasciclin domain-containing protein [Amorphus sp. MBR-141]